jgi:hypothetical protein
MFFVGCNQPTKKQKDVHNNTVSQNTIIDSLSRNFQGVDLDMEEDSICFDTLKIVSANCKLLYYPVGRHNDIETFLGSLPKEAFAEKRAKINGGETYFIKVKNNYIEVLVGEDYCGISDLAVNIVNAEIKNSTMEIANCIRTGMTKQTFFEALNLINTNDLNEIKVVELISVLSGIWQYYTFNESDILTKIEIKSDYIFE